MKIYISFLIVLVIFLSGCEKKQVKTHTDENEANFTTISGLSWYNNIDTGLHIAKKENKKLIIMVGEESCKWCKKMKERTLVNAKVNDKMKAYILVSVKRSDKEAIKHLPTFDGNIPSFFFMQPNKEVIESIVGYYNADDFLQYMNEAEE